MKKRNINSEALLARYLSGDRAVSINDIEKAEYNEKLDYAVSKYSNGNRFLKFAIIPLVLFGFLLFDHNS